MDKFCVEVLRPAANLRADDGILRRAALAVTENAEVAAADIVRRAESEADRILQDARAEAQQAVEMAEMRSVQSAAKLLSQLEKTNSTFLDHAESMVLELTQRVFALMVADMTPLEKIQIALQRVLQEAPPRLVQAVLRAHADDIPSLPALEWEVKPDSGLPRGACKLEARSGEWSMDFDLGVAALRAALDDISIDVRGSMAQG